MNRVMLLAGICLPGICLPVIASGQTARLSWQLFDGVTYEQVQDPERAAAGDYWAALFVTISPLLGVLDTGSPENVVGFATLLSGTYTTNRPGIIDQAGFLSGWYLDQSSGSEGTTVLNPDTNRWLVGGPEALLWLISEPFTAPIALFPIEHDGIYTRLDTTFEIDFFFSCRRTWSGSRCDPNMPSPDYSELDLEILPSRAAVLGVPGPGTGAALAIAGLGVARRRVARARGI